MAREKMKKRKARTLEDYIEALIQDDYENKNGRL